VYQRTLQTQCNVRSFAYLSKPNPRQLFSKRIFATWHSSVKILALFTQQPLQLSIYVTNNIWYNCQTDKCVLSEWFHTKLLQHIGMNNKKRLQIQYRIFQVQCCLSFRSTNIRKPLLPVGLPSFLIRHAHCRFSLSVLLTKYYSGNQINKYWAGHPARTAERRAAYTVLLGKPHWKRQLGSPRRRWKENIKMNLKW